MMYFNFRKMYFIVLFTLFPGITPAFMIHEKVVFYNVNDIALSKSKRLSTFIIHLSYLKTSQISCQKIRKG